MHILRSRRTVLVAVPLLAGMIAMTAGGIAAQTFVPGGNQLPASDPSANAFPFDSQQQLFAPLHDPSPQPPVPPGGNPDEVHRQCMLASITRREQAMLQVYQQYYQQLIHARQQYAQQLISVWSIPDSRQRRDAERQVERAFREYVRETDSHLREARNAITRQFRDERRECDRIKRELERQLRTVSRNGQSFSSISPFAASNTQVNPAVSQFQYNPAAFTTQPLPGQPQGTQFQPGSIPPLSGGPVYYDPHDPVNRPQQQINVGDCLCQQVCQPGQACILVCKVECSKMPTVGTD